MWPSPIASESVVQGCSCARRAWDKPPSRNPLIRKRCGGQRRPSGSANRFARPQIPVCAGARA
eukprot:10640378-Alexandrium_andersonii.AAC.1